MFVNVPAYVSLKCSTWCLKLYHMCARTLQFFSRIQHTYFSTFPLALVPAVLLSFFTRMLNGSATTALSLYFTEGIVSDSSNLLAIFSGSLDFK